MTPEMIEIASESLRAAFAGQESWPDALGTVSRLANARGGFIIPLSPGNHDRLTSESLSEPLVEYENYWHKHDFRRALIGKILRTGIGVDQDIIAPDDMARLPFYDYLANHGLRWFAGIPFSDGDDAWVLTLQRTPEQGPFEIEEQNRLRLLGCVLSQSVSLARRLAAARTSGLLDGLAIAGSSAVLLDRLGRVLHANERLDDGLRRDLRIEVGLPMLASSVLRAALLERMDAALRLSGHSDHPLLRPLMVTRIGRSPIRLRLRALKDENARFYQEAVMLVLIDDPDRGAQVSSVALRETFNLTPAQARIAASIGTGVKVKDCADQLGVGIETVRTTLKAIFQKVGVSRQAELVKVLLQISQE